MNTQPYALNPVGCGRLQNFAVYNEYSAKKQTIAVKNIPNLPSTQTLAKGGVQSIFIDKTTNEFYFWHYASNLNDVLSGKPLKKAIDGDL